ncbi:MAG: 30S ribosomal protein S20 [Bacillota bacterium]|nr:30S ribosomal protein S20 [Bacillota bacterium]
MPNIKSQIKRDKTNLKAKAYNDSVENGIRTAVKKVEAAAKEGKKEEAVALLASANKLIDEGVSKGSINKNAASRKKSHLAKLVNSL